MTFPDPNPNGISRAVRFPRCDVIGSVGMLRGGRAAAGSGEQLTYTRPPSGIDWKVRLGRGNGGSVSAKSFFNLY